MRRFVFVAVMGVFFLSYPVWADMYRYKDANGIIRFTDNLSNVPVNQRSGITVYENAPSSAAILVTEQPAGLNTTNGHNQEMSEISLGSDSAADTVKSADISVDSSKIDRLLKTKTELDEENVRLVKESLALTKDRKTFSGNADIQSYNEKINALNARVDDYEKRRAAFQKEADTFDADVKNKLAPVPQPHQSISK
jgi:hypothetical protein